MNINHIAVVECHKVILFFLMLLLPVYANGQIVPKRTIGEKFSDSDRRKIELDTPKDLYRIFPDDKNIISPSKGRGRRQLQTVDEEDRRDLEHYLIDGTEEDVLRRSINYHNAAYKFEEGYRVIGSTWNSAWELHENGRVLSYSDVRDRLTSLLAQNGAPTDTMIPHEYGKRVRGRGMKIVELVLSLARQLALSGRYKEARQLIFSQHAEANRILGLYQAIILESEGDYRAATAKVINSSYVRGPLLSNGTPHIRYPRTLINYDDSKILKFLISNVDYDGGQVYDKFNNPGLPYSPNESWTWFHQFIYEMRKRAEVERLSVRDCWQKYWPKQISDDDQLIAKFYFPTGLDDFPVPLPEGRTDHYVSAIPISHEYKGINEYYRLKRVAKEEKEARIVKEKAEKDKRAIAAYRAAYPLHQAFPKVLPRVKLIPADPENDSGGEFCNFNRYRFGSTFILNDQKLKALSIGGLTELRDVRRSSALVEISRRSIWKGDLKNAFQLLANPPDPVSLAIPPIKRSVSYRELQKKYTKQEVAIYLSVILEKQRLFDDIEDILAEARSTNQPSYAKPNGWFTGFSPFYAWKIWSNELFEDREGEEIRTGTAFDGGQAYDLYMEIMFYDYRVRSKTWVDLFAAEMLKRSKNEKRTRRECWIEYWPEFDTRNRFIIDFFFPTDIKTIPIQPAGGNK